jgi:hypothetical protein
VCAWIRTSIVLGILLAAIGMASAVAAQVPSDAHERAQPVAPVVTDSHQRAQQPVGPAVTDAHQRSQLVATTTPVAAEEAGWDVDWTNLVLGAVIGAAIVVGGVLLAITIRRHPPRGHPPLAHR